VTQSIVFWNCAPQIAGGVRRTGQWSVLDAILLTSATHAEVTSQKFLKALHRGDIFQNAGTLTLMHHWRKLDFPLRYGFGTMSMKLPWIFSPFNPIPELTGHFGSTGIGLFYCADLDVYLMGATNQGKSQAKLNRLIIGMINLMKKLE
jgi:hypothetical protein